MLSAKQIKELTGIHKKIAGLNKIANQIEKRKWKNWNLSGIDFKKQLVHFYRISKIDNDTGVCSEHIQLNLIDVFDCISGDLNSIMGVL